MSKDAFQFTSEQLDLASELTTLQRKAVIEIMKPKTSQRQAYINAGGTAKTESSQDACATVMFSNAKVKAFHASLLDTAMSRSIMERNEALEILSNNARVKMTDVADYEFVQVGEDDLGNPIMQTVWAMKDSKDIDPALISCIKSVTMTRQGPKIELHDQQGAIKQLTEMQGWAAPKRTEITGNEGEALHVKTDISSPEITKAINDLMSNL